MASDCGCWCMAGVQDWSCAGQRELYIKLATDYRDMAAASQAAEKRQPGEAVCFENR